MRDSDPIAQFDLRKKHWYLSNDAYIITVQHHDKKKKKHSAKLPITQF